MTRFIYIIPKDSSQPGSYTVIDGVWLQDEGSGELYEGMIFEDTCNELRDVFDDPSMRFAEVVDGEIVSFNLPML